MLLHPWKHLLTNVHTAKKQWHFSLVRGFLWKWWRDMIGFLSWLSDCGSITFIWKFVGNIFIPTESGVTYINSWFFFLQSCSLLSNSSKKKKKKGKARLHLFHCSQDLFRQCIKMHTIVSHNLNYYCTAWSPCPGFSPDRVDRTPMCGCCWAAGVSLGPGQATEQRSRHLHRGQLHCNTAHGPWIGHTWPNLWIT